jgi:hypothetical protein
MFGHNIHIIFPLYSVKEGTGTNAHLREGGKEGKSLRGKRLKFNSLFCYILARANESLRYFG